MAATKAAKLEAKAAATAPKTWTDGEVITAVALNELEQNAGRVAAKTAAVSAADAAAVSAADATAAAAATVTKEEFNAVVTLANECKAKYNAAVTELNAVKTTLNGLLSALETAGLQTK